MAALIEVVDFGNRMFHAANMKGSPPSPVVIKRPTIEAPSEPERRPATAEEMKAFFGGAVTFTPTTEQHRA